MLCCFELFDNLRGKKRSFGIISCRFVCLYQIFELPIKKNAKHGEHPAKDCKALLGVMLCLFVNAVLSTVRSDYFSTLTVLPLARRTMLTPFCKPFCEAPRVLK